MKCVFCAEEIQPEAVVCRFCRAVKTAGEWRAAPVPMPLPRGLLSLRFAAATLGLSAVSEALSLSSPVPLAGALRHGVVAVAYHGVYAAMFAALFVGLWQRRGWSYPALLGATCFYTLDNVRLVLDRSGLRAKLATEISTLRGLVDEASLMSTATASALIFTGCWWLFALWVRRRRDLLTG